MYTGSADKICVISEESRYVAKELEKIVSLFNENHGIEAYDKINNKGFWRLLLYRESKETKECMISVIVTDTSQVDEKAEIEEGMPTDEQLQAIKSSISSVFKVGNKLPSDKNYTITSVSMIHTRELSGGYKEDDRAELLSGETFSYTEQVYGFKFTVSPFAFF